MQIVTNWNKQTCLAIHCAYSFLPLTCPVPRLDSQLRGLSFYSNSQWQCCGHVHMYGLQQLRHHGTVWTHPGHFAGKAVVLDSQVSTSVTEKTLSCEYTQLYMGPGKKTPYFLQDPPSFRVPPRPEYLQEVGRELIIPCEASGDPNPNITWSKVQYFLIGRGAAQTRLIIHSLF